jgi:hypothetical protein
LLANIAAECRSSGGHLKRRDLREPIGKRLTLHLGLRTENEHVPSLSGDPRVPRTAIHFGFGDKLAPRAGFAWDATGDGKTKLYGSWGVFYDITKLGLSFSFGGSSSLVYWYTLETGDVGAIVDNPSCPPACPGSLILGPVEFYAPINDPDNNGIDPALDPMRLQEAVLGVERELAPNLSVTARYVHKQIDRAVEDIGTLDAQQNEIFTLGNPGFGRADYQFLEEVGNGETQPDLGSGTHERRIL